MADTVGDMQCLASQRTRSCGPFAEFHSREAFASSNWAWSHKAWP